MSSASPEEKNDEPIASTSDEASTTNEVSKRKGTKVVREFEFQKIPLPDFVIGVRRHSQFDILNALV